MTGHQFDSIMTELMLISKRQEQIDNDFQTQFNSFTEDINKIRQDIKELMSLLPDSIEVEKDIHDLRLDIDSIKDEGGM